LLLSAGIVVVASKVCLVSLQGEKRTPLKKLLTNLLTISYSPRDEKGRSFRGFTHFLKKGIFFFLSIWCAACVQRLLSSSSEQDNSETLTCNFQRIQSIFNHLQLGRRVVTNTLAAPETSLKEFYVHWIHALRANFVQDSLAAGYDGSLATVYQIGYVDIVS